MVRTSGQSESDSIYEGGCRVDPRLEKAFNICRVCIKSWLDTCGPSRRVGRRFFATMCCNSALSRGSSTPPREQRCPSVHTYISTFRYEAFADGSPPETRKGSLPVVRKYFCTSRLLLAFSVGSAVVYRDHVLQLGAQSGGFHHSPREQKVLSCILSTNPDIELFHPQNPRWRRGEEREREEEMRGEMKGRRRRLLALLGGWHECHATWRR
ncbi:hypothetical protein BSL78_10271 [Apostichopus japonicus]|uniref:Uncharacterized protein n=1 Tax=Stichopus japonicus TaxID=307972 RepID=A0A2G8KXW8_STIJA|nr:hypothetical protein BSL78_10271 [Apostichopus japonicus]